MPSYHQSATYSHSSSSYGYGHRHAMSVNDSAYSSRSSSSKKRAALGGGSGLRWICPNCPGSNNSWEYDSSCPLCFKPRPAAPATFYN
ncbi:hypothetical protein PFICI_02824 [Pestalotiopsis fici W106-1]|uniref:Uncharacterized protein n=1 Tax=Pestalotiopsis fici (strain W106-1 / CGMCC3.15140) TaxID=1229662 RepID=W3XFM2_PESFW|nr:uncharacterized protein PFICI_02824 [Pestalotiopsis fici W106-1]ETS84799.1 hypothetical protein PFICI_02824 [Pestalotiopsis fici W106-1]